MTVDELQVLITANTANLQQELKKTQSQLSNLEKASGQTSSKMLTGFKVFKAGLLALGIGKLIQAIGNELGSAIKRVDTMNNYTRVMGNLAISSKDAEDSILVLKDKLIGLPTTLDQAASAVQRFASANGNVKASTSMFLALNNAILAGGASTEIQSSALEQLSRAYAKGKPDMMEWRTAMMAMPAQLKQVGLAMGYASADQLGEALRSGTVSMNEFMVMLTKLNKEGANGFKSFEEQARNSTGGIQTSVMNVKTAIQRGLADIMDAIGQSNIAGFFDMIRRAIDAVIPYIAGFVKAMVTAVSIVARLFGYKGKNKTKETAESTAGAISSVGGAGSDASDGLDKATGSAKKLNKELHGLAAFDEMNVLKEQDTSSGGGGSSGSGGADFSGLGDIDLSMFDNLESSSKKMDEIADKILNAMKKVFDFLKSFDYSAIVTHVKSIGTALVDIFTNDKVQTSAKNLFENTIQTFKNVTKNIYQIGLNIGEALVGSIDKYLTQQKDRIAGFISNMFNIRIDMNNIISGLSDAYAEISKIFKTDDMKQIGADIINIFVDPLMTATEVISKFTRDFVNILVKPIIDNSEKLRETMEKTLGPIRTVFDTLSGAISYMGETFNQVYDEHLKPLFDSLASGLSDTFSKFLDVYNEYIQPFIQRMSEQLQELWDNHLKGLWDNVSGLLGSIGDALKVLWEQWLKPVIDWIIQNIIPIIVPICERIWLVVKAVLSIVIDVISGIIGVLKGIIDFLVGIFTGDWDKAWSGIKGIFESIWNMIKSIVLTIWDTIKGVVQTGIDFVKAVISAIANWIVTKFNMIRDTIHNVMTAIKTGMTNIWNSILNTVRGVINGILGGIEAMCNGVIRGLNKIITPLTKVGNKILSVVGIKNFSFSPIPEVSIPRLESGMNFVPKDYFGPVYLDYGERVLTKEENQDYSTNKTPQRIVINLGGEKIFDEFIDYTNEKSFATNGEVLFNV